MIQHACTSLVGKVTIRESSFKFFVTTKDIFSRIQISYLSKPNNRPNTQIDPTLKMQIYVQ